MAQDQTYKRRNIAHEAVDEATRLWDAVVALDNLRLEFVQAGTFLDADFDGTTDTHLTAYMTQVLLDTVVPAIKNVIDTEHIDPNNTATALLRDILLQVRR